MWSITDTLPTYLQVLDFSLTEDEDFVILWHEGEWIGRYYMNSPLWRMVGDAKTHLAEKHGITDIPEGLAMTFHAGEVACSPTGGSFQTAEVMANKEAR